MKVPEEIRAAFRRELDDMPPAPGFARKAAARVRRVRPRRRHFATRALVGLALAMPVLAGTIFLITVGVLLYPVTTGTSGAHSTTRPSPRAGSAVAFDSQHQQLVVFGGTVNGIESS